MNKELREKVDKKLEQFLSYLGISYEYAEDECRELRGELINLIRTATLEEFQATHQRKVIEVRLRTLDEAIEAVENIKSVFASGGANLLTKSQVKEAIRGKK